MLVLLMLQDTISAHEAPVVFMSPDGNTLEYCAWVQAYGAKCALLGCYAANSGNFLPTFRDNLSVPSSGFKNFEILVLDSWSVKMGPICCAETSVRYDHYSLSDNQEKGSSHFWVLYTKSGSEAWQVAWSGTGLVQTKYNSAEGNLSFWSLPMEHVSACTQSLRLRGLCSSSLWRS